MKTPRARAFARVVGLSVAAMSVYGGWAAWVNGAHGPEAQARAGMAQGFASLVATAAITGIIEALRIRFRNRSRGDVIAVAIAATTASAWHVCVNLIAGTRSLAATVAPAIAMAWVFGAVYAMGLRRVARIESGAVAAISAPQK